MLPHRNKYVIIWYNKLTIYEVKSMSKHKTRAFRYAKTAFLFLLVTLLIFTMFACKGLGPRHDGVIELEDEIEIEGGDPVHHQQRKRYAR